MTIDVLLTTKDIVHIYHCYKLRTLHCSKLCELQFVRVLRWKHKLYQEASGVKIKPKTHKACRESKPWYKEILYKYDNTIYSSLVLLYRHLFFCPIFDSQKAVIKFNAWSFLVVLFGVLLCSITYCKIIKGIGNKVYCLF